MKKSLTVAFLGLSALALGACDKADWRNDCTRNFSEDSRTLAQCEARAKSDSTGSTGISLEDVNIPRVPEEIGSGQDQTR
ncbi:MAG: hypothetical protein GY915_02150 [bacterium]|nr:hypothetical protein [bacterium]